jgi:hypothetical protein
MPLEENGEVSEHIILKNKLKGNQYGLLMDGVVREKYVGRLRESFRSQGIAPHQSGEERCSVPLDSQAMLKATIRLQLPTWRRKTEKYPLKDK